MKFCKGCQTDKDESEFRSKGVGKRYYICRKCEYKKKKEHGLCMRCGRKPAVGYTCQDCTEGKKNYYRKYRKTPRVLIRETLYRIKNIICKTKKRNELHNSCTLTLKELLELYNKQDGKCAITGMKMTSFTNDIMCLSLDRINSDGLYDINNVMFTCRWVNLGRNKCSISEFNEKVLEPLRNQRL